jgi:hypothetical protein
MGRHALDDGQRGLGIVALEVLHQGDREVAPEAGRHADHGAPDRRAAHFLHILVHPVDLVQDAAGVLQQALARFGHAHPAAVAGEQGLPEFDFELAHLPAQRRLGDIEQGGGAREAAQFGDMQKIRELLDVHGYPGSN